MTEWFEQWFGEEYLRLYPDRDDEDAARAVSLIARVVPLRGARVLDLACGPGRHATHLAAQGALVVGFDLSMPLLSLAKHRSPGTWNLVRGDMRFLPFRPDSFELVVNLFTSFGYFSDDRQHLGVMQEACTALVSGGRFVLDYLNAAYVRDTLLPREERVAGAQRIIIERHLTEDGRHVVKQMHILNDGRSFVERVRLFHVDDLTTMMRRAGLTVAALLGDYDGRPLRDDTPRAILVGVRP